jgi:phytoene desaturase
MSEAVVIGGGFGGIAAALRARAKGYNVTLFDQCTQLGGRAQVFHKKGFTFDAGPTVITAPFLFEELFSLFNKNINDYVDIVPVEPWYRFYFPDGDTFDYSADIEETIAEIERISPKDADGYRTLLKVSEEIFDIGFTELADTPFHEFSKMLSQVPHLIRLKCFQSVWQLVSSHLSHDKLRQAFSIQPLLVGGNPFDTTCIYNLIHFLERKWGVHFAMGGMGALTKALEKLMVEEGISINLNTSVSSIETDMGFVKSVNLANGSNKTCDVLISNCDPKHFYKHMVSAKDSDLSAKIKSKFAKSSMGLYVLYFGTNKQYDDIAHHTIWLGKRYQALLTDIFDKKVLADDFSLYIHRPTASDPTLAPEGCDTFYVLSPVPNLEGGQDWQSIRKEYGNKIISALENTLLPDLRKNICVQFDMTPMDFKSDYLSESGTGFSVAPTLLQSAWFRFHNKSEGIKNAFLVGAGTHPGAGLPGVLSSAKVLEHILPSAPISSLSHNRS